MHYCLSYRKVAEIINFFAFSSDALIFAKKALNLHK